MGCMDRRQGHEARQGRAGLCAGMVGIHIPSAWHDLSYCCMSPCCALLRARFTAPAAGWQQETLRVRLLLRQYLTHLSHADPRTYSCAPCYRRPTTSSRPWPCTRITAVPTCLELQLASRPMEAPETRPGGVLSCTRSATGCIAQQPGHQACIAGDASRSPGPTGFPTLHICIAGDAWHSHQFQQVSLTLHICMRSGQHVNKTRMPRISQKSVQ